MQGVINQLQLCKKLKQMTKLWTTVIVVIGRHILNHLLFQNAVYETWFKYALWYCINVWNVQDVNIFDQNFKIDFNVMSQQVDKLVMKIQAI